MTNHGGAATSASSFENCSDRLMFISEWSADGFDKRIRALMRNGCGKLDIEQTSIFQAAALDRVWAAGTEWH